MIPRGFFSSLRRDELVHKAWNFRAILGKLVNESEKLGIRVSYLYPIMKPHEDWVDGSWTVDCVCGVKFDDGKEMVNCDECGVWVHAWCSRYVKGDDLFACHKCKIRNNDIQVSAAKLLVTKRMEDFSSQGQTVDRGFRPCTDIPIEERVHVQGFPGGDLALFESFSSVFSPQLWKCTGYVPKKFRFQYKEFPCWDEKENVCEIVHQEDVLLSMSKENDVTRVLNAKETDDVEKLGRSCGFREMEMKDSQSAVINKDKSLVCPLNTNKVRKELFRASEDRVKKKKAKVVDKEEEEEEDDKKDFVGKTGQLEPLSCPYNAIRRL